MKKYKAVYLKFYDHCLDTPENAKPIICEVFGILYKQDKQAYYITSWVCNSNLKDHNNETYCILKSTVLDLQELDRC